MTMTVKHADDAEFIGSYLINPAMPDELKAIIADHRREDQIRVGSEAARARHQADPIPGFRADVLDRAERHVLWQVDRGEQRGLMAPEIADAEHAMLAALSDLSEAESEEDRDAASEAAHDALSHWKHVLENQARPINGPAFDQCLEVDQGEVGTLLRCVDGLDYLASAAARQRFTREQILLDLAATLFECPQPPAEE